MSKPEPKSDAQIQEKREKSEEQYRLLVENMTDLVVKIDTAGCFIYVSPSFCDLFGKSEQELLGKPNLPFIHEEDREAAARASARLHQPPYTCYLQHRAHTVLGLRWLAWSEKALFDENKRIIAVVGVGRDITERKIAKLELAESEERFKILTNQSPNMIFIHDRERIVYVNEKCVEIMGYSCEEFYAQDFDFFSLILPSDRKKVKHNFRAHLQNQEVDQIEYTILTKSGGRIAAILNTKLIDYKGGRAIMGIVTDISVQERAKEKIKVVQRQQAAILDNIPDMAWLKDTKGRYSAVNEAFVRICGRPANKIIGRSVSDLWPADMARKYQETYKKVLRSRKPLRMEEEIVDQEGRRFWVETIKSPVFNSDKELIGTAGISRDITESKHIQHMLRTSEEKYHSIFNGSRDAVFIADSDARFIEVNEAASDLTGYSREELIQSRIPDLHDDVDRHAYDQFFDRIMSGECLSSEAKMLRKDGTKIDVEFSNRRIVIGGLPFMHTTARDVSERKLAEEKIRISLREKEALLKEIHHRVKNNMQIISSLIRLQTRDLEDHKIRELSREMQARINSMALIHNQLYNSEELSRIDLGDYIASLGRHLMILYDNRSYDIRLEYELEKVNLDINRAIPCGLIANELISNCFKHAFPETYIKTKPEHFVPKITIALDPLASGAIRFKVSDNGIGFSDNRGLGLVLVGDLIKQIEGTLERKDVEGTSYEVCFYPE